MKLAHGGRDSVNTQREVHFRDAERVLVAFETLLPVIPETWTRDPERSYTSGTLHNSRECLVIEAPGVVQCAACTTVHGDPSGSIAALSSLFLEILQGAVIKLLFLPNPFGIGFVPLKPNEI